MGNFSRLYSLFILGITVVPVVHAETLWSVGHGYLSGGVLGVQYQNIYDDHKFSLAVGLVGTSAAWQVSLDAAQKHSVGMAAGFEARTAAGAGAAAGAGSGDCPSDGSRDRIARSSQLAAALGVFQ